MTLSLPKTSVEVVDLNGYVLLGKEFAGRKVLIEEKEPGVWLLRTGIAENELWLHEPESRADLLRALEWAKHNPPRDSDPDAILNRNS